MAEYLNAEKLLPEDLLEQVRDHLPTTASGGALIYFRCEDFYGERNKQIRERWQQELANKTRLTNMTAVSDALSKEFLLSPRHIRKIATGK